MASLNFGRRILWSRVPLANAVKWNGCNTNLLNCQRRSLSFAPEQMSRSKIVLLASGAFIASAAGASWYENKKEKEAALDLLKSELLWDSEQRKFNKSQYSLINQSKKVPLDKIEAIPVSRHVPGPTILPGNVKLKIFQYQTCPFCCKVRTFLDYYGIPYEVVEVNAVLRNQIKFSDYRKVPILIISRAKTEEDKRDKDDEHSMITEPLQLNDSTLIISMLGTYLLCNENAKDSLNSIADLYQTMSYANLEGDSNVHEIVNKYFLMKGDEVSAASQKSEVKKLAEERKWREWADSVFVHALSPNIYRTMNEALDSFKNFSVVGDWETNFPAWQRLVAIYVGAPAMYLIGKRLKKKYMLKGDVRESLYDVCRQWTKAIGKDRQFMGGDKPNLADLAVFGAMSSIEGCAAFDDALEKTNIGSWYNATKQAVTTHAGNQDLKQ